MTIGLHTDVAENHVNRSMPHIRCAAGEDILNDKYSTNSF
jgi:hypothetical protein